MSTSTTEKRLPPSVRIFSGRSESFTQADPGATWVRLTAEDEAKWATGTNRETKVPSIGVYVIRTGSGRVKVGFDLWRLSANLTRAVLTRLENRWRSEDAPLFSKTALHSLDRKVHVSKSFVTVITLPERVAFWTDEFVSVLSNPDSFEPLERRPSMIETFHTSDYGQVAFLLARGFAFDRSESNGNEVVFHFTPSPSLLAAISDYGSNSPIPCRDFFHAIRRTKALIRENTNERNARRR